MLKPLSKPFARLALRYGDRAGQAGPSQAGPSRPGQAEPAKRYRYIQSRAKIQIH